MISAPVSDGALALAEPRYVAPGLVTCDAQGRPQLTAGRCSACGARSFPKAPVCASCLSEDIADEALSREGKLYAFSVVHQAPKGWRVPYVLGYVDLPEDVRVLAHIAAAPDRLRADMPVRLSVGEVGTDASGAPLSTYTFTPIA
jgi:uncharacterized OB-fold protein